MAVSYKDKPGAADVLATSQGDIQGNFEYLQAVLGGSGGTGKDHQVTFGTNNSTNSGEGRHNSVGLIDHGVQAFPGGGGDSVDSFWYSTSGNSFWRNSSKGPYQMTNSTAGVVSAGANGNTFLPGGFILQWGTFSDTAASGMVTFATSNISFPANCYIVLLTFSNTNQNVVITAKNSTTFTWAAKGPQSTTVYWTAIGN